MFKRFVVFFLLLVALGAAGEERRALLVGINDYSASGIERAASGSRPAAPEAEGGRSSWPNLTGAVNDATAMREMLIARYGFAPDRIRVLVDQEATRAAILAAIEEHLIQPASRGDQVLFYFAGHGSRVVNSRSAEPDGMDETRVPADSRLGVRDIRDKELARLFHRILDRHARLTVIFDSCYSGSGGRGLPRWARPRGLEPDLRDVADGTSPGPPPEARGALVLSAAQDFERAWETWDESGESHGAFSLALLRAMRASGVHDSAEQVFLRARAWLQSEKAFQDPVLAGAQAETLPLFGGRTDHRGGKTVVAVTGVGEEGTISFQGGWVHGLSEGSELQRFDLRPGEPGVRLRVTTLDGLSRSTAETLSFDRGAPATAIKTGELFELVGWATPPGPPLRVWIPEAGADWQAVRKAAAEIESRGAQLGAHWVEDPVEESPTHVASWRGGLWHLLISDDRIVSLGVGPVADAVFTILRRQISPTGLFVLLPAPTRLVRGIEIGAGTDHSAVERTTDPARADYFLVGRLRGGRVEYAWIRPTITRAEQGRAALPLRSDWYPLLGSEPGEADHVPAARPLEEAVLRLARIRSWLALESPPGGDFPYHLALQAAGKESAVKTGGTLPAGTRYGLILQACEQDLLRGVVPRFTYVFSIDSFGKCTLLFPAGPQGNVENRFPIEPPGEVLPTEITLGEHPLFEVDKPFGTDTYFLLTSKEAIPNPWVFECSRVRTRGLETALEELLFQTSSASQSRKPLVTPVTWSIERLFFESVSAPGS